MYKNQSFQSFRDYNVLPNSFHKCKSKKSKDLASVFQSTVNKNRSKNILTVVLAFG